MGLDKLRSEIVDIKEQIEATTDVASQAAMLNVLAVLYQKELFLLQRER